MKSFSFLLFLALLAVACSKDSIGTDGSTTGKSGSITRFTIYNGYMYMLNPNEVLTYSLANPDQPQHVHTLKTEYGLETIIIYENTIYLGSTSALYILDISNPAAPSILSKTDRITDQFFSGCDPVVVKDNYAYSTVKIIQNICGVASTQSALLVYDVSNKNAPSLKGNYPLTIPNGLGYKDNYLFVCDEGSDKLEVFDISNPLNLVQLYDASINITDPYDLIVDDNKMIVSTKTDFHFYDISALPAITKIGQIGK